MRVLDCRSHPSPIGPHCFAIFAGLPLGWGLESQYIKIQAQSGLNHSHNHLAMALGEGNDNHTHLCQHFEAAYAWHHDICIKQRGIFGQRLLNEDFDIPENILEYCHKFADKFFGESSEGSKQVDDDFARCDAVLFIVMTKYVQHSAEK